MIYNNNNACGECVSEHVTKKAPLTIMYNVYEIIPVYWCKDCSIAHLV